jgi:predicted RNase H-like HicB family nuclease
MRLARYQPVPNRSVTPWSVAMARRYCDDAPTKCRKTREMPRLIVVRATWDPEAQVWVAESTDVPGLVTEAETIPALEAKLPNMIRDLLETEEGGGATVELPVQIIAETFTRVQVRSRAPA